MHGGEIIMQEPCWPQCSHKRIQHLEIEGFQFDDTGVNVIDDMKPMSTTIYR